MFLMMTSGSGGAGNEVSWQRITSGPPFHNSDGGTSPAHKTNKAMAVPKILMLQYESFQSLRFDEGKRSMRDLCRDQRGNAHPRKGTRVDRLKAEGI